MYGRGLTVEVFHRGFWGYVGTPLTPNEAGEACMRCLAGDRASKRAWGAGALQRRGPSLLGFWPVSTLRRRRARRWLLAARLPLRLPSRLALLFLPRSGAVPGGRVRQRYRRYR